MFFDYSSSFFTRQSRRRSPFSSSSPAFLLPPKDEPPLSLETSSSSDFFFFKFWSCSLPGVLRSPPFPRPRSFPLGHCLLFSFPRFGFPLLFCVQFSPLADSAVNTVSFFRFPRQYNGVALSSRRVELPFYSSFCGLPLSCPFSFGHLRCYLMPDMRPPNLT